MTRKSSSDDEQGNRSPTNRPSTDARSRRSILRATGVALTTGLGIGSSGLVGAQSAAEDSSEAGPDDAGESMGEPAGATTVTLALENLPALEAGAYEGWAITGDEKVSTGTFTAAEEPRSFSLEVDLSATDRVAITVEPDDEAGGDPSGIVVLAGDVADGEAALSFPTTFDDVAGSYILATPTAPLVGGESGVWFLEPGEEPSPSLSLPELPAGWTYEGWAIHEGTPISTGRFGDPAGADDSSVHEGRGDGPPFPGEDLITNEPTEDLLFPSDLTDGETAIAITVEPALDGTDPTGPAPYPIKPLEGAIPADAEPMTSYDLEPTGAPVPAGTATIETGAVDDGIQVGEYTARDRDGDGRYEDVNGSGGLGSDDVVTFFEVFEGDAVQNHPEAFDFNDSGAVGMEDVTALYRML